MDLTNIPTLVAVPFASGAGTDYINPIPVASQIPTTPGAASYTDGFVPVNFQPIASGGVPPFGKDMNGILNALSVANRWNQAGGQYSFDSTFCTAIGGYPRGSVLLRSDYSGHWISTANSNTDDPETAGSAWLPYGESNSLLNLTVSGSNITLTPLQAARGVIRLNGTLTANINLVFPNWPGFEWTIINNYAASTYHITAKMATGASVALSPAGASSLYSDGTNLINNAQQVGPATDAGHAVNLGQFTSSKTTNGWMQRPDGMIEQWGTFSPTSTATQLATLPIPFPTAGLWGCATSKGLNVTASCAQVTTTQISLQSSTANVAMFWRALGY